MLIPFVVMLSAVEASNHERNPLVQRFPNNLLVKTIFTALAAFALTYNAHAAGNDYQETTDKALAAGGPEAVLKALKLR